MKKLFFVFVLTFSFLSTNFLNANSAADLSDECEEFAALLFVGSLERGMDPIDAYDLAMWGRWDCENNW